MSQTANAYSTRMRVDLINRRTTSHFFPSSATPCDKREERGEGYRWEARTKREDVYSRSSRVQSEEEQQLHLTTSRGSGLRQIKYFKLNRGKRESGRERERRGREMVVVGVGGFFPPYLLLSSFSPGRREFSFYNKRP